MRASKISKLFITIIIVVFFISISFSKILSNKSGQNKNSVSKPKTTYTIFKKSDVSKPKTTFTIYKLIQIKKPGKTYKYKNQTYNKTSVDEAIKNLEKLDNFSPMSRSRTAHSGIVSGGNEIVKLFAEIIADKASAHAFETIQKKILKSLGCNTERLSNFKNVCNAVGKIRIQDLISSPDKLKNALLKDIISLSFINNNFFLYKHSLQNIKNKLINNIESIKNKFKNLATNIKKISKNI